MVYSDKERWKFMHRSQSYPLNAITVCDSQEPPLVYLYTEQCSVRSIYSGLDLFVGYDHHTLVEESRDYTTFDTPLGTMYLTVFPQGWTGSVSIFHNDIAFICKGTTYSSLDNLVWVSII